MLRWLTLHLSGSGFRIGLGFRVDYQAKHHCEKVYVFVVLIFGGGTPKEERLKVGNSGLV